MNRDDPRLNVQIQYVLGVMAIRQNTAIHRHNRFIHQNVDEAVISYEAGKRDALADIAKWLREYTDWDTTLAELNHATKE